MWPLQHKMWNTKAKDIEQRSRNCWQKVEHKVERRSSKVDKIENKSNTRSNKGWNMTEGSNTKSKTCWKMIDKLSTKGWTHVEQKIETNWKQGRTHNEQIQKISNTSTTTRSNKYTVFEATNCVKKVDLDSKTPLEQAKKCLTHTASASFLMVGRGCSRIEY